MLNCVKMKEYAVAEIEIDKEKTNKVILALDEAIIGLMNIDKEQFTESICELMNLKEMFQSIETDFRG